MSEMRQITWRLPPDISQGEITASISGKFRCATEPGIRSERVYYDTFDWRLLRKDMCLFCRGNHWHLVRRQDGKVIAAAQADGRRNRFWWDFPQSDFRRRLEKILQMRSLLPLGRVVREKTILRLLNSDEKTVAYVELISCGNSGADEAPQQELTLRPVRGYRGKYAKLSRYLQRLGFGEPEGPADEMQVALQGNPRRPLDYSSRFSPVLDPKATSLAAARTLFQDLLQTMRCNEAGILDDLDSEFLHDFRVAVRRTRSALAMFKKVLPPEVVGGFGESFRTIGRVTGPTRDLDVYGLMEDDYRARLPQWLQPGLVYFFEDLREQRRRERRKLVRFLKSDAYGEIISNWRAFLDSDDHHGGRLAEVGIDRLSRRLIRKRFRRVVADGRAITRESPDESLHRLRIQGKKLRYMLEFFRSLYPKKEMKTLITQLKGLQNTLGDFNDLSVQLDMLRHYLETVKPGTIRSRELAAAIGGLMTNIHHEQRRVRTRFEDSFTRFASPENTATYQRLFT